MQTRHKILDGRHYFVVNNLSAELEAGAKEMDFTPFEDGLARTFDASLPDLDRIFHNFTRHAERLFLQKAGIQSVPWDVALLAFLKKVEGKGVDWWLRGSAALAVRGLPVTPGDIDLTTDAEGSHDFVALFRDDLVMPHQPVTNWLMDWWGIAFLHARIEWMGGVNDTCDQPEVSDFGPEAARRSQLVTWRGYDIRVPPLDLQMKVCGWRSLTERAALIQQAIEHNICGQS